MSDKSHLKQLAERGELSSLTKVLKSSSGTHTYELRLCCSKFAVMALEDDMVSFMSLSSLTSNEFEDPAVYICSDGGHGGMEPINFCPWCGSPIEVVEDDT